ncbi:MAG: hypothetical protein IKX36_07105 [Prevotella sp.]|nr:hypothetical protein [Prevotella sp.]
MKKQLFFTFILLFSSMVALAQSDDIQNGQAIESRRTPGVIEYAWNLVVWHKDGSKVMFLLDEVPHIIHEGERVIVKSSSTVEYDYQAIKKMTYSLEEMTGIRDLTVNKEVPFSRSGGTITFVPAEKDLHVQIFLTNGMVVKDFVVRQGDSSTISLSSSLEKIYLINVNGVTYKIKIR